MPTALTMSNGALATFKLPVDADVSGNNWPYTKLAFGPDGTQTLVTTTVGLPVDTEIKTADFDLGAGTDTQAAVGLRLAKSGGSALWPGDETNGGLVNVMQMPNVDRQLDSIAAALVSDRLMLDKTPATPLFAPIAMSSAGTANVVAGVATKKLRLVAAVMVASAAVAVKWVSNGGAPTDKSGAMALGANGGVVFPFSPVGWLETVTAEPLALNLSANAGVNGVAVYIQV